MPEPKYDPSPLTLPQMVEAGSYGWNPQAMEMVNRLVASGLDQELAIIAVHEMMGMNSKGPAQPTTKPPMNEQQQWDAYARENPGKATAKKLLVKGGEIVKGATKPIWGSKDLMQEAEKMSAAKMLQEYLQAQDAQRAGQMQKEQLWMLARQPGQYMGPTTPTENNQVFAAQDNAIYQAQNKRR